MTGRSLPEVPVLAVAYAIVFAGTLLLAPGDRFGYLMGVAAASIAIVITDAVEGLR